MRLIYLPCEKYRERWTEFVSGSDGVVETQLTELKIPYLPIRPHSDVKEIESGIVLDTVERCNWGFAQVKDLVQMIFDGRISADDTIFIEDFWLPGMEMIPYALSMKDLKIPIYSFCHAQSVDPNDFTAKMAWWMRGFEASWARCQKKIFTAAPELCTMLNEGKVTVNQQALAVGTMFDSKVLKRIGLVPDDFNPIKCERENAVVWSSRWDKEKNPDFFCELAKDVFRDYADGPDLKEDCPVFYVCTGASELKSNSVDLLNEAESMQNAYPYTFKILTGLSKPDYYKQLSTAKVQFNAADQDFVSYTLLEAATFGCAPLYPNYLTFPAALNYKWEHLYRKGDLVSAKEKLYNLLSKSSHDYSWVYRKYENSLKRMLKVMGFDFPGVADLPDLESVLSEKR